MRVTEKGQVTIPKPIRDRLGIGPGSEVDFVDMPDGVHLVRSSVRKPGRDERYLRIRAQLETLKGSFDSDGMDGKAYVDWLRGPRDDHDPD